MIFTIHNIWRLWRFSDDSALFLKIFEVFRNLSKGQTNVSEHFSDIFNHLLKITEDSQRLAKMAEEGFVHTPTKCSKGTVTITYISVY